MHRIQGITVGLFSFYLLQGVGGSVGLGVASRWLQWQEADYQFTLLYA